MREHYKPNSATLRVYVVISGLGMVERNRRSNVLTARSKLMPARRCQTLNLERHDRHLMSQFIVIPGNLCRICLVSSCFVREPKSYEFHGPQLGLGFFNHNSRQEVCEVRQPTHEL